MVRGQCLTLAGDWGLSRDAIAMGGAGNIQFAHSFWRLTHGS
ncbi:hypothetical protein F0726_02073 [Acidithiobacillus caldus]|nr:hypothetical protein F0726_02073 [Acidithiobacillus caldus]